MAEAAAVLTTRWSREQGTEVVVGGPTTPTQLRYLTLPFKCFESMDDAPQLPIGGGSLGSDHATRIDPTLVVLY